MVGMTRITLRGSLIIKHEGFEGYKVYRLSFRSICVAAITARLVTSALRGLTEFLREQRDTSASPEAG